VSWSRWDAGNLVLNLPVQTRAARDGLAGGMGNAMRLLVTAPPAQGRANAHVVELLAEQFGVAKRAVYIEQGLRARQKRGRIARPARLSPQVTEGGGQ
jgi:uncharacterized protein (TIGR00251 family)